MRASWRVIPKSKEIQINDPSLSSIVVDLLQIRGIVAPDKVHEFLYPDFREHTHDPFLFKDMAKVIDRLYSAINNYEPMVIYGDYDADGVCSSALLYSVLRDLGANIIDVYLPDRADGYGLHNSAIDDFIKKSVKLLVTLDCGTTNIEEISRANNGGIDVIVVDHHHVPETMPGSFALLNAKMPNELYPFKHLASGGMAFKVAQGLLQKKIAQKSDERSKWEAYEKWLLDLTAIATVTDLVSLTGENRTLLKYGLVVLNKTKRAGLKAIIEVMGGQLGKIDTFGIGFQIGPRLNAAGRMSHAKIAFEVLTCVDENKALELAKRLDRENRARQSLTEKIFKDAENILEKKTESKIIVVAGESWPVGLVGLVASRLCEQRNRPVLVISKTDQGFVGSGRSIPCFNIIEALHKMPELFVKFGGHAQACGFTLKKEGDIEVLYNRLNLLADETIKLDDLVPIIKVDLEIFLADVNWDLFEKLQMFEPFGMDNPRPKFLICGLYVVGLNAVGATGQHLKLSLTDGQGVVRPAIGFRLGNFVQSLSLGDRIDVITEICINEWNGNRELQLNIIDIRNTLI